MKKTTLLLLLFVAGFVNAQIVNIPDANFKDALINLGIDTDNDGEIQVSEADAVTGMLNVAGQNITDLQGIEAFVNITGLNCFENLLTSLDVSFNTSLVTLECGLNGLTSLNVTSNIFLETLECFNNNLTSLDVSNNLDLISLGCSFNDLTSLDVSNNLNLLTLDSRFNDLTSLDVSNNLDLITLRFMNNNLTSLDVSNNIALEQIFASNNSLTTFDGTNNHNLIDLDLIGNPIETIFIKNGSVESINALFETILGGNVPSLMYICADAIQVAEIQSFAGGAYVVNTYCSFQPGGDLNVVEGMSHLDTNNDGCDPGDPVFPFMNLSVGLDPNPANGVVFTDNTGSYAIYMGETGTYSITPNLEDPSYFTIDPSFVSIDAPVIDNSVTVQDFCVTANGVRPDTEVVIGAITPARPGFDAEYILVYKNKGNQVVSGTVDFEYDDTVLDFVSSTTTPDTQSTGVLSFDFIDLQPFENRVVEIVLNVNGPTETPPINIDDVLNFTGTIAIDQADETPDDNIFQYNQIVVGAFDPNDITCLQGDVAPSDLIGDFLHYIINFENTGNAPAENVVVTTQIDPSDFDINTLQILNTSDDMSINITNNLVEFVFENINLSSGGHGNILLRMRTNSNLVISDFVAAEADIYFDFNFPITTNTANTTFETLSVDEFSAEQVISLYPNPSDTVVTVEASSMIQNVKIYDVQGRTILYREANNQTTSIDISQFANGMYFLVIKTDSGEVTKRVLKK